MADRPKLKLDELSPRIHWVLQGIEDINGDAPNSACPLCGSVLSWAQWLNSADYHMRTECHKCGKFLRPSSGAAKAPTAEYIEALSEPGYFDRLWYHTSKDRNWARTVRHADGGQALVHAGSRLSALSRADDLYEDDQDSTYYLHSFRLRSTRRFDTRLFGDACTNWQRWLSIPLNAMDLHVSPLENSPVESPIREGGKLGLGYYNRYELPGEVSILFHAPLVQLNTVETVELTR